MSADRRIYTRYATQEEYNRQAATLLNEVAGVLDSSTTAAKSGDFTVAQNAGIYLVDASASAISVTLPPASAYKYKSFHIKKAEGSGGAITITPNGSETIDGASSLVISAPYASYRLTSDGSNWYIT